MAYDKHLYKKIKEKVNELGFTDSDVGTLKADLNDLAEASNDFLEKLQILLALDANNKNDVVDTLIKIQLIMEHIGYHVKSGLPLIKKLIKKYT